MKTIRARLGASSLGLGVDASRAAHDYAVHEQEHSHGQEQMDPAGSCGGEGDDCPNDEHRHAQNQEIVHSENSLTYSVTADMFRQTLRQLLHEKNSTSSL